MGGGMARVQLVIPDEERERFVRQARMEGMTFSMWLRAAARQRLEERQRSNLFGSQVDLDEFFDACNAIEGPAIEPEWREHLSAMEASRRGSGAGR